jgi:hypothetical protein
VPKASLSCRAGTNQPLGFLTGATSSTADDVRFGTLQHLGSGDAAGRAPTLMTS